MPLSSTRSRCPSKNEKTGKLISSLATRTRGAKCLRVGIESQCDPVGKRRSYPVGARKKEFFFPPRRFNSLPHHPYITQSIDSRAAPP